MAFWRGGDDDRRSPDPLINLRFLMRLVAEATGPIALAWSKGWPQRTNLWRERTNPGTGVCATKGYQPEGDLGEAKNKHFLSPPQAELEALASPTPRSGPLSALR